MRLIIIREADELSVKGRSSIIIKKKKRFFEIPLRDVEALLIIGSNTRISSSLPPVLSVKNVPLSIIAKGSVSVMVNPIGIYFNNYRKLQYQLPKINALNIAFEYINSKIKGMINILKYRRIPPPQIVQPPEESEDETQYERAIRIWESVASNILWKIIINNLLHEDKLKELREKYNFRGRKPKSPDPFNKTVSVMYSVLYSLATKAIIAAGLDPSYGFIHRSRYSTPLTFDYTEMFKPVAIEASIDLINKEGLPVLDFDGELKKEWINKAINYLYKYLELKHKDTKISVFRYIFIKAFCLAKYLNGECRIKNLTVTWDRRLYRRLRKKKT